MATEHIDLKDYERLSDRIIDNTDSKDKIPLY